jgi:GT2 family glycosyltransferase
VVDAPLDVAISIIAFRSADTIEGAVRSSLGQTHPGRVEVIVRNQSDDPEEARLLAGLDVDARTADAPGPRTLHVEHGDNRGPTGGHNANLRRTDAPVVLFLNADARLEPDFLATALPHLRSQPDVAAVQGLVLRPAAPGEVPVVDAAGMHASPARRFTTRGQGRPADGYRTGGDVFGPDLAVALFRRVALDDVALENRHGPGPFDESFFMYMDDIDLAYRLLWRGWRTVYVPEARAWHRRSARDDLDAGLLDLYRARASGPLFAKTYGFANQRLTLLRNETWARFRRDLRPYVRREALAWAALLSNPKVAVKAIQLLVRGAPSVWRTRPSVHGRAVPGADPYRWFTEDDAVR